MRHEPVHQSFTRNAVNQPDQTAISFGGSSLSYSELLTRAHQIANLLLSAGARHSSPVAILCSLPPDIIAAIIGVLKAGCAFVPVDTQLPVNKLASMFGVGRSAFDVSLMSLLQHRLMKLVPIVQIVQVHRVFWRSSVIRNFACAQNPRARFVVMIVAAHGRVVLFDRVLI